MYDTLRESIRLANKYMVSILLGTSINVLLFYVDVCEFQTGWTFFSCVGC